MDIPVEITNKKNHDEQLAAAIEKYNANVGLMITYSYRIPGNIIAKPQYGFYNVHPGPLPSYRGADPIFQQIKNREKKAVVSLHKLDEGIDSGPVIMQEVIPLNEYDTYGMINSRLAQAAVKPIRTLLKLISFDLPVPFKVQDEREARYYKKQQADEIVINWETMEAPEIIALINACNPWNKGAVTKLNNRIIRLLEAEIAETPFSPAHPPGTVVQIDEQGMFIKTIKDQLLKVKIIYADEGFMNASRINQTAIKPGDRFQKI